MNMTERDCEGQKIVEGAFALTWKAMQSVINDEKREATVYSINGVTGRAELCSVPGVDSAMARRVIQMVDEKLGVDLTAGEEISCTPDYYNPPNVNAVTQYGTNIRGIVILIKDVRPFDAGYYYERTVTIKNRSFGARTRAAVERAKRVTGYLLQAPWPC